MQASDREYMTFLVDLYYDRVFNVVWYVTRKKELAEDATQEAFLKAYQRMGTLRDKDRVLSWLISIAMNTARDMLRKEKYILYFNVLDIYDEHMFSWTSSPEDIVIENEGNSVVWVLIGSLPEQDKRLIYMRYFLRLSNIEIAEMVGDKGDNIRIRLYRIRNQMRQQLEHLSAISEYTASV